jgi:hypothetical protein
MPLLGIAMFVVVIAALFLLTYALSRRYSIGRGRRVEEVATETELRDGMAGAPTGGFLPYFSNRDPSPRERLRSTEPPERD